MRACIVFLFALAFPIAFADSEEGAISADQQFHSTFDRLVGEDWLFHIDLIDAAGEVIYSSVDVRRFEYGIGGAFLIENAYRLEDGVHAGIQLIGLNRQDRTIHLSTFFQWKATALADVVAHFSETGGVKGTSTAMLPDGSLVKERFECEWVDDRWTCASFRIEEDGSERISNRNYYCRRSDPDCGD